MSQQKLLSAVAIAALGLCAAVPAHAITTVYTAVLTGPAEAPPNNSPAFGLGIVTFDSVASTMKVNEQYFGLTGGAVTGAHIHCCTTVANTGTAPVVVDFVASGFPTTSFGNFDFTFTLAPSLFATLTAGAAAGQAYLNIHTTALPGGEIRGFLTAPVPEPASYALLLGGLAAVGWFARRKSLHDA